MSPSMILSHGFATFHLAARPPVILKMGKQSTSTVWSTLRPRFFSMDLSKMMVYVDSSATTTSVKIGTPSSTTPPQGDPPSSGAARDSLLWGQQRNIQSEAACMPLARTEWRPSLQ
eukprot:CAMPEP_0194483450 /NCGR_PEP_ID=MMETSP0253-20130528/5058_1 /TAXON_ID=2966 /ORGANISM="Noctiluca scintillans" /LENGTH=115 /DNA_ID=CAMNT_0039323113 /DNA_START=451 /DNA_END=799 /DNA_ORIENTATION=+